MDKVNELFMYTELALYAALTILALAGALYLYRKAKLAEADTDAQNLHWHYQWAQYRANLDEWDTGLVHDTTAKVFKLDEE